MSKKKGGKGGDDDDFLAEFAAEAKAAKAAQKKGGAAGGAAAAPAAAAAGAEGGDEGGDEGGAPGTLSKAAKKRLADKRKKEEAAAAIAAGGAPPEPAAAKPAPAPKAAAEKPAPAPAKAAAPAPAAAPAKAPAKVSAQVLAIRKAQEAKRAAEQAAAEERRRLAEEERLEREEAERKAKEKAEIRAKLKKEGKILTKAQLAKQAELRRQREALIRSGMMPAAALRSLGLVNDDELGGSDDEAGEDGEEGAVAGAASPAAADPEASGSAKPAAPRVAPKSKAQLEAERLRALQQQIEERKARLAEEALVQLRATKPEATAAWEAAKAALEAAQEEVVALACKVSELKALVGADDAAAAAGADGAAGEAAADSWEEEVADDWDAEPAPEDPNKTALAAAVAALEAANKTTLPAAQAAFTALNGPFSAERAALAAKIGREQDSKKKAEDALAAENSAGGSRGGDSGTLRSPIVVVLGHVDSGKTSLLDRIRNSNVTKHEARGITQQIGASFIPQDTVEEITARLPAADRAALQLPGMIMIDTPGHESFAMLRERGSALCDVAILVVDMAKGIEEMTRQSLDILHKGKTPFVVALTKVDRIHPDWGVSGKKDRQGVELAPRSEDDMFAPIAEVYAASSATARDRYDSKLEDAFLRFAEQGVNAKPFDSNPDLREWVSMVPVSSKQGEGIPDLLRVVSQLATIRLEERLAAQAKDAFECTVLEVKTTEGYGVTLDVILSAGTIRENDTIVAASLGGPIVTTVRQLLTPPPLKELRLKSEMVSRQSIKAAMGFKIVAKGLESVLAGTSVFVKGPRDDIEDLKDRVQEELHAVTSQLDRDACGVFVHASSLGSLEALIRLLKEHNIPISGFDIGPVHKISVAKAATQLAKPKSEYAMILAFDVKEQPGVAEEAERAGVKMLVSDIVYQLKDQALAHFEALKDKQRKDRKPAFPVVLVPIENAVFNNCDPIIMGVTVQAGTLREDTPLWIPPFKSDGPDGEVLGGVVLGRVTSIKLQDKPVPRAAEQLKVSIRIDQSHMQHKTMFGRHFKYNPAMRIVSHLSAADMSHLEEFYKDELTAKDRAIMAHIRKTLDYQKKQAEGNSN